MTQSSDGGPDRPAPDGDGDLRGRLDRLGRELDRRSVASAAKVDETRSSRSDASGFAQAMRLSSEFIAGVLVGGLIGWGFDWALGAKPWGLIVFVLLGFAAGVLNVMRSAGLIKNPPGA